MSGRLVEIGALQIDCHAERFRRVQDLFASVLVQFADIGRLDQYGVSEPLENDCLSLTRIIRGTTLIANGPINVMLTSCDKSGSSPEKANAVAAIAVWCVTGFADPRNHKISERTENFVLHYEAGGLGQLNG